MSKNYRGRLKQKAQNRGYNPKPAERPADFTNTGGAWDTRAYPSTTQPKRHRRKPPPHRARPENGETWPSRAPKSRNPSGACRPRSELRQQAWPVRPAAGANGDGDSGQRARVKRTSTSERRSGVKHLKKKTIKLAKNIPPTTQIQQKKSGWRAVEK
jgi:hypothetical protein